MAKCDVFSSLTLKFVTIGVTGSEKLEPANAEHHDTPPGCALAVNKRTESYKTLSTKQNQHSRNTGKEKWLKHVNTHTHTHKPEHNFETWV